jgi:tRNA(Ile)-lysidine synthase
MLLGLENKVAEFAKINGLFDSTDKILLAVSGGADSMALMYAMCALKRQGVFSGELLCVHINHQLRRGEADVDEDFVAAQATRLNLPLTTRCVDVRGFARANKLSIETAARQLRIASLLDIAGHNNCGSIATGHQKNDNAETVLQRLARGTGFRGLAGIWPKRVFEDKIKPVSPQDASRQSRVERFVRPLLCVTRDEVLQYLERQNLKWRTDHTNVDCTYRRNYIRHRLLPVLQQDCAGSIVEQLAELSQSARRLDNMVCRRADKVWPDMADSTGDSVVLKSESFLPEHPAVKVELIRRSLAAIGSGERDLTHRHYETICQLAGRNVGGRRIELPGGFLVRREYGRLVFARVGEPHVKRGAKYLSAGRTTDLACGFTAGSVAEVQNYQGVTLQIPGRTRFGDYIVDATILEADGNTMEILRMDSCLRRNDSVGASRFVERFDLEHLNLPLLVRLRQTGDRFWPLGLSGQKKVGKFLTDAKVPQEIRRTVLIVADREKIIWVWPIRISESAKVTNKTCKILQLQIVV